MNEVFEWREAPESDFAVIGNPVSHSLSPKMHAAIYRTLDLPWTYTAVRVSEGEVGVALDRLMGLGVRGVNVTVPHKEEALDWATDVEPFALKVRATNTIDLEMRSCINTDAPGFIDTIQQLPIKGRNVLVLGAGGSARALVAALTGAGWAIKIFNRTYSKATELAEQNGCTAVEVADPMGMDLVLNTTSSAFDSETPPVDWGRAGVWTVAYDLMYAKNATPFLRAASGRGLRTVDGLGLLVAQGARSFEWWTGMSAPRDAMISALQRE